MIDRKAFFDRVRADPFGGSLSGSQVTGISTILDLWERRGGGDMRHLAYALATTFHETARTMQPIEEYGHGHGRAYGAPVGPWHLIYDGRGDVQLTWIGNYTKATARLKALGFDVDLVRHPEQAMRPDVAAMVLLVGMEEGWFTGAGLPHFFGDMTDDPVGARRIINGTDCAEKIAGYHRAFLAALKAAVAPPPTLIASQNPASATPELDSIMRAIPAHAAEAGVVPKTVQPVDAKGRTAAQIGAQIREAQRLVDATPKVAPPSPVSADYLPTQHIDNAKAQPLTGWRAVLANVRAHFGQAT